MIEILTTVLMAASPPLNCPHPLLERDATGRILRGGEANVVDALRAGGRLRIGWYHARGSAPPSVIHWVDGTFLTERSRHVYAQFGAIHSQRPTREAIVFPEEHGTWRGLVGTDGTLQGRRDDREVGSRTVPMIWCESPETYRDRCASDWRVVYRNDAHGRPVAGSKAALIRALHTGRPLRIAWGGKKGDIAWAHSADPVFVTATTGPEVVANLPPHVAQQSYHDPSKARFVDESWLWTGLLSTDGRFDAVWTDSGTGRQVRRIPQRAAVSWLAFIPPDGCDNASPSLSVVGGVVRDPTRPAVDKRSP